MSTDRGCGFTTQAILAELRRVSVAEFGEQLDLMRVKGRARTQQIAAFEDGMATATRHLVGMGVVVIRSDT